MNSIKLKSISYYNKNKNDLGIFGDQWKNYSWRRVIGNCSYLHKILNPKDFQDFMDKYVESGEGNDFDIETLRGDDTRGRTIEQLKAIANAYFQDSIKKNPIAEDFGYERFFDDVINHVIIETMIGKTIENALSDKIRQKTDKYEIIETYGKFDALFGIDLVLKDKKTRRMVNFFQIKPVSFFTSNRWDTKKDRINHFRKEREFKQYLSSINSDEYKPVEYVVYDKRYFMETNGLIRLLKINNKTRLLLEDLCDSKGDSKIGKYNELEWFDIKKFQ